MLLAIDAGNTNIVFAVFREAELLGQWRMSTHPAATADEYAVWLMQLMRLNHIDPSHIGGAIVASVVPQALFDLRTLCRKYFNTELMVVGAPGVDCGITLAVDAPEEVGADRIVNAFAAWKRHQKALIVVDFGTATTFDVVSGNGEYVGGVIAPGVNLSLDALQKAAAKLPNVGIARPDRVVGRNTVAAMQSGIYFGYLSLIEGITARIAEEMGMQMEIIATGGLAPLYTKASNLIQYLEPDLTILGLRDIFERNRKKT